MRRNRRITPPCVSGGSSLLVIFAVLCLTTFALLVLSTVRADTRLSDASVQAVADYYAADAEAEEIFARLRAGEDPEGVTQDGNCYRYTCQVSDTQELQVILQKGIDIWTVLRWQEVSTADWTPDENLPVWEGE